MEEEFKDNTSTKGACQSAHETEAGQPHYVGCVLYGLPEGWVGATCYLVQFNPCHTLSLEGIASWSQ